MLARIIRKAGLVLNAALLCGLMACSPKPVTYDLVIENGRIIDPETKMDKVAHVGLRDGVIARISDAALQGVDTIDATGLVVAPGFIDIHSHSPTPLGVKYQVRDGVTTILDLEAGAFPVSDFGAMIKGASPINYASSVSHLFARMKVIEDVDQSYLLTEKGPMVAGAAFVQPATPEQVEEMRAFLDQGLESGGVGIGLLLDYLSIAVSEAELRMIFEVASANEAPIIVHLRRGLPGDSAGLVEIIELAEQMDVAVLICHITHNAMQALPEWLAMIDAANARGGKITTETLSYAAGGTSIGAAVFGRDWQSIFNITYADVQWTATGEWMTEESFNRYREEEPSGMVNHHYVKEDWIETAIRWPRMMISSDVTPAVSENILANPNLSGTFARLLGHYARDEGVIDLSDAIARITLYPAEWLESTAPAFNRKGRVQEGMDADITIFNPDTIAAHAIYGNPYQPSAGIHHVIVDGVPVVRDSELTGVLTGQHILAGPVP